MADKSDVASLRNVGKVTAQWLHEVGIHSAKTLRELGPVEAYKRLKAAYPKQVSLIALYGLEAALLDIDWRAIPDGRKAELRDEVEETDG